MPRCPLDTAANSNSVSVVPVDVIAPFDVVATDAKGLRDIAPLYGPVVLKKIKISTKNKMIKYFFHYIVFSLTFVYLPDEVDVDSVVTVIDELDNKC